MSAPAIAQLRFINTIPIDAQERPASSGTGPCPELAGCKVRVLGSPAIYVIDGEGYRRYVPFPLTLINLFKDRAALEDVLVSEAIAEIPEAPALDEGALLVRGMCSETIYLLDKGRRRLVSGPQVISRYDFDLASVVAVPQIVLEAIPVGEPWT